VPQDAALFHGSLRDNIKFGNSDVSDDAITQAVKDVGLAEFVNLHPQGLNAEVGERGVLLSGGQRRAVVLARCLVRDYGTLLLDEPTANLDPHTEVQIINTLRQLKRKRNVNLIIATHKKSVLDLVERAIVLENGKIVSDGTPQSVIGKSTGKPLAKPAITVSNRKKTANA